MATVWGGLAVLALASAATAVSQTQKPAERGSAEAVVFGELPQVEAASLHAQSLAEAPANVSVITAEEIRDYGYRTLGEALAAVRGFYVTDDHMYRYVGVRGFSLPGDFNTRFLVMLNGHPLTDNIYNSNNYFGQDFGLDMDLVERIEIIRGPTSALYGSNGMLANINVVTRSPVDEPGLRLGFETSSFEERKVSVNSSMYLGGGANLLIAGSFFHNGGISFPLEGLALPAGTEPPVSNADGERGYHSFVNLIWHDWSFTGYFNQREKRPPVGLGTSLSGDPRQFVLDARHFVEAGYKRHVGPGTLQARISFDRYRYEDRYNYPDGEDIDPVLDINHGDWFSSQASYALPVPRVGTLTVGAQGFWEVRNLQYNLIEGVPQDRISRPDRGLAVFAQQEWELSRRWKLYSGVRLDETRYYRSFVSPRLAVVYQPSPRTVYKLVYGRPFRNPSAFEQFYNDEGRSYLPAPPLMPEAAHAFEGSFERRVARDWTLIVNAFHYRIERVIQAITLENEVQQYQNADEYRSTGVELETAAKWNRIEGTASAAFQEALESDGRHLANAPRMVAKLRLGRPVGRWFLSGNLRYVSPRETWTEDRLGGALVADATATLHLRRSLDIQVGLRNGFDRRYEDPIYLTVDRLRGDGRSVFVKLAWRLWE